MANQSSVLNYNVTLKIKDQEYTRDLQKVRIVSNIASPYQVVAIDILLDQNDVILNSIYGKEPIKLQIDMIDLNEGIPIEHIDMELMYLEAKSSATIKPSLSDEKTFEKTMFNLLTVPRQPFKAMTKIINNLYIGKTPTQIVTDLVSEAGCQLFMDKEDKNLDVIDQVLIPNLTLYKAIQYLDDNFGLYNGASNLGFCQYDNKFYVMNLSKRLNKSQVYTIYHLSTDAEDTTKIIQKVVDGKNFYTYGELKSDYTGNSVFATFAKLSHIILKPDNDLFKSTDFDLKKICADYGATFKTTEVDFDPSLNDRETYVIGDSGYGEGSVSASWISRRIMGLASLSFDIGKNIPILNLINVGEPVKLITKTAEYVSLSGKYLLKSSDINLDKVAAGFIATCGVTLMRTNKTI